MKRIGLLGGSFNPPHSGHLHIVQEAHKEIGLDEAWLLISYNIFKDPAVYAPLEQRKEMAEILAQDYSWLKVKDIEKDLFSGQTATTLTLLEAFYPQTKFVWIFGDDNFAKYHEEFFYRRDVPPGIAGGCDRQQSGHLWRGSVHS